MNGVAKVKKFEKIGFVAINRNDLQPYPMRLPFDWDCNPFQDDNWRFQLQTLRYLMIYLEAAKETGDFGYIEKLLGWIEDWWLYVVASKEPLFAWQDMATGIRAEKIAAIVAFLKASERKVPGFMNELIECHIKRMMEPGFFRDNHNHGMYVAHGLRCLADFSSKRDAILTVSKGFWRRLIKNQLDENYVHKEHSPHYHFLFVESLARYLKTDLYDDLEDLRFAYDNALAAGGFLRFPDGREIPFGDTDNAPCLGYMPRTSDNLADYELQCLSGYLVFKGPEERSSYFAITNNYHSKIHKHWDNGSFVYGEDGQDIIVDPGKYKYSQDKIRERVISSGSHNTMNIKGLGWSAANLKRDSLALEGEFIDGALNAWSKFAVSYDGCCRSFERFFNYKKGRLVINDVANTPENEKITSRFNLYHSAQVVGFAETSGFLFDVEGVKVRFRFYTVSDDGERKHVLPKIERIPVSYSYGSFVYSPSLIIEYPCRLESVITIEEC